MSFMKLPVLRHGLMVRHEDILPDSAVTRRIEAVRKLMATNKVAALAVYSDATHTGPVCYLTNYPCYGLGRRAVAVLGPKEGPFLFTAEPSRNLPRVRRFTTCDLEKARRYLPAAFERVKAFSAEGVVGLAGLTNLATGPLKDVEKDLAGLKEKDLSQELAVLLAAKDESSLKATKQALAMAEQGMKLLSEQAASGKDLWQMAAYADYRLRLLGCEDTNILLACSGQGRLRPGYPAKTRPRPQDTIIALVAAQYARHWGITGRNLFVGPAPKAFENRGGQLSRAREQIASQIKPGMTIDQVVSVVSKVGSQTGLSFGLDLPVASGIGFDLSEYPNRPEDRIGQNTVLQVALAADIDNSTVMAVDMLHVTQSGGAWLAPDAK